MDNFNVYEYAEEKELHYSFSDLCKNKEEVDAILSCLSFIREEAPKYHHAIALRPHDIKHRKKHLQELLNKAKNETEQEDILKESEAFYPTNSTVQEIKNDILIYCETIMRNSGMGKKKWLKLRPALTKYLNSGYEPQTQNERVKASIDKMKTNKILNSLKLSPIK